MVCFTLEVHVILLGHGGVIGEMVGNWGNGGDSLEELFYYRNLEMCMILLG